MDQKERLDYLVEEFKADSADYRNLRTPADQEGQSYGITVNFEK